MLLIASIAFAYQNNKKNGLLDKWQDWGNSQEQVEPEPQVEPQDPKVEPQAPINKDPQSYEEALKMAKEQDKTVFLFFSTESCGWCVKMKQNTLSDDDVKKILSDYIIYYADASKEVELRRKYDVSGVPNYFIIDKNEKIIKEGIGYKGEESFKKWIEGSDKKNQKGWQRKPG